MFKKHGGLAFSFTMSKMVLQWMFVVPCGWMATPQHRKLHKACLLALSPAVLRVPHRSLSLAVQRDKQLEKEWNEVGAVVIWFYFSSLFFYLKSCCKQSINFPLGLIKFFLNLKPAALDHSAGNYIIKLDIVLLFYYGFWLLSWPSSSTLCVFKYIYIY